MIKKLLICASIVAGLSSCTEDFKDWLSPQQNSAEKAAEAFVMTVSPAVSDIDFATYTEENVQLFSTNLEAGQTDSYTVVFAGNDKTATYTTADGSIPTAELASIVTDLYGRAPKSRAISTSVSADVKVTTGSTTVVAEKNVAPFNFNAKPDAPIIKEKYYYLGSLATDKSYVFTNSGADVYEDPVFTCVIPASSDSWHWFRLATDESYNAEGNIDWGLEGASNTSVCPKVKDDDAREGECQTGTMSWHLDQSDGAPSYLVSINMLDMTYSIKAIPAVPEYYIVGRQNGWSLSTGSALMPVTNTSASYTSYFTGAWDCRIATTQQIADGNWNNFGSAEENGSCTTLAENTGKCIMSPAEGYYTLTVDFATMTYSWTPVSGTPASYDKIGLVGAGDDWDNDIFLTKVQGSSDLNGNDTHNWSAIGVELKAATWGVQFRANAGWDMQWGTSNANTSGNYIYGAATAKDNIPFTEGGTYNIYFNDITGQFFFVKQ